jgi:uncharacterized membrane protein
MVATYRQRSAAALIGISSLVVAIILLMKNCRTLRLAGFAGIGVVASGYRFTSNVRHLAKRYALSHRVRVTSGPVRVPKH